MRFPARTILAAALAACFLGFMAWELTRPKQPIIIGFMGSLTGKFSDLTTASRDGALLAAEEINQAGGIQGRPLTLVIRDDRSDSATAVALADEFSRTDAQALIGAMISANAVPVMRRVNERGLLTLGVISSTEQVAGRDDFYLRLAASASEMGDALARRAVALQPGRRFVLMLDTFNGPYVEDTAKGFCFALADLRQPAPITVRFNSKTRPPFSRLAQQVLGSSPDAVLIVASPIDTALLCQRLRALRPGLPLFASHWSFTHELIENGGAAVEGLRACMPSNPLALEPGVEGFFAAYERRFHQMPSWASLGGYEAVQLLAGALRRDTRARAEGLKAMLVGRAGLPGLHGTYTIDGDGDIHRPLRLLIVRQGRFAEDS